MNKHILKFVISLTVAVFALCICVALGACNGNNTNTNTDKEATNATTTATTAPPASPTIKLNVMSFNILYKNENNVSVNNVPKGETIKADLRISTRLPKLIAMLEGEKIDIAGLQEVNADWYPFITTKLPENYSAFGQFANDNKQSVYGYGEAGVIVYNNTKYELLESGYYYLAPKDPDKPKKGWDADHYRIVNWGVFKEKETGVIFFFNTTHFDNTGEKARTESSKLVLQKVQDKIQEIKTTYSIENIPTILVGDFNCYETSDCIMNLKTIFKDARYSSKGVSINTDVSSSPGLYFCNSKSDINKRGHYIDFILHTKEGFTVNSFKMIHTSTNLCEYGEFMSDHNAVIANVTISN